MTQRMAAWLILSTAACGFGHEVEQDGSYAIVASTSVNDAAPYPLEKLLIVEEDLSLGQTRLYFFAGELARADLGLEDLRRIERRHGGFQMAFDPPRERIDADEIQTRNRPLRAQLGDRSIELKRLDDTGLRASGASRYLAYAISPDYEVAAYFGVVDALGPLEIVRRDVEFEPRIDDPALGSADDGELLALDYESNADYVVIELQQRLQRRVGEDAIATEASEVDALVRTSLAPDAPYRVGAALLTDVAGQGCWSPERKLEARLTQVARRYQQQASGDWASLHLRIDAVEIGVDRWTRLLGEPKPATYCQEFE